MHVLAVSFSLLFADILKLVIGAVNTLLVQDVMYSSYEEAIFLQTSGPALEAPGVCFGFLLHIFDVYYIIPQIYSKCQICSTIFLEGFNVGSSELLAFLQHI